MTNNYKKLIQNWHDKATDEDYFSKFTFEYLAFIAYLRTQKFTNARNDRDALQRLKIDSLTSQHYFGSCDNAAKESYKTLQEEFENNARFGNTSGLHDAEEVKWWNHVCPVDSFCRNSGCGDSPAGTRDFTDEMKGKFYGEEDWGNLVEFWATVRNNLFHGSKNPEGERDQLVVEHGYRTLASLMDCFLSENL